MHVEELIQADAVQLAGVGVLGGPVIFAVVDENFFVFSNITRCRIDAMTRGGVGRPLCVGAGIMIEQRTIAQHDRSALAIKRPAVEVIVQDRINTLPSFFKDNTGALFNAPALGDVDVGKNPIAMDRRKGNAR